jgi:hypothetical protein
MTELTRAVSILLRPDDTRTVGNLSIDPLADGRLLLTGTFAEDGRFRYELPADFDDWGFLKAYSRNALNKHVECVEVSVRRCL